MEKEFKEKFHNCYPSVRVIHCEAQVYRDARSSVINLLSGITAYVYAFNEYHPHGLWREYSSKRRLDDKKRIVKRFFSSLRTSGEKIYKFPKNEGKKITI